MQPDEAAHQRQLREPERTHQEAVGPADAHYGLGSAVDVGTTDYSQQHGAAEVTLRGPLRLAQFYWSCAPGLQQDSWEALQPGEDAWQDPQGGQQLEQPHDGLQWDEEEHKEEQYYDVEEEHGGQKDVPRPLSTPL